MVASVIGWFFLTLLVLLVVLLVMPVIAGVELRGGSFTLWVRVFFVIKLRVLPAKEGAERKPKKKKKADKDAAEKPKEEGKKKEPQKRSITEWMDLIRRLAESASKALRIILKALRIYDVEVVLPVEAAEPKDVALRYGGVQAALGGTRAALENLLHIRYRRLVVIPDFTGESKNRLVLACKVAVSPVIILAAGIAAFAHFLRQSHFIRRHMALRAAKKRRKRIEKQRREAAAQNAGS